MRRQPKVIIVGGSLVGPSGDLFFRRRGYTDITVLEANPRPFSQSGGVMGVRANTLDMLGDVGIHAATVQALTSPDVYAFDINGGETPDLRGVSSFPGMVTSWDALHAELDKRVNVTRGHTVTNLVDDAGRTYVICTCGQQHDADVIVWADGRKSTGRTILAPNRPLTYNGYAVWRGLVQPPAQPPTGFHRYYDIEGGRLFSLTEPIVQSGMSYFEFSHNLPADEWQTLTGKSPEEAAYLLPGWVKRHPQVHDLIRRYAVGLPHRFEDIIDQAEVSGIPVNDVTFPDQLIYRHASGAVSVLIGDAAIPVRLQVGAGLNQGVQQIHDFVTAYASRHPDALSHWEARHIASAARWVELGRSRAHRNNLGWYLPVHKGQTTAPEADQWTNPRWVAA